MKMPAPVLIREQVHIHQQKRKSSISASRSRSILPHKPDEQSSYSSSESSFAQELMQIQNTKAANIKYIFLIKFLCLILSLLKPLL